MANIEKEIREELERGTTKYLSAEDQKHLKTAATHSPKAESLIYLYFSKKASDEENYPTCYNAHVDLARIESAFYAYMSAQTGMNKAELLEAGYRADMSPDGHLLTVTAPDQKHAEGFISHLQEQKMISDKPLTKEGEQQSQNSEGPDQGEPFRQLTPRPFPMPSMRPDGK